MALAKCRECGNQVSDEAKACPHCGVATPVQKPIGIFGIIMVGVVGLLAFQACSPPGNPSNAPAAATPSDLGSSARYVCKDFITRSGYSVPDFGDWSSWTTVQNSDGTWSVGARFMGAAPGGSMRNLYLTCVMSNTGDKWALVSLARLQ